MDFFSQCEDVENKFQSWLSLISFSEKSLSDKCFEGVQGQKSWKHNFEITSDPKGTPSEPTFWLDFEATPFLRLRQDPKIENGH